MMKSLFELGDKIGLIPSALLCGLTYVVFWILVGRVIPAMLWQYPYLAYSLDMIVIVFAGLSGLFWFWLLADLIEFRRLGYRVRWITENEWVYEERNTKNERQYLPFLSKALSEGYMPPRNVYLLNEAVWESQTPKWAQGRRAQIIERIANCLGADQGVAIQFLNQSNE